MLAHGALSRAVCLGCSVGRRARRSRYSVDAVRRRRQARPPRRGVARPRWRPRATSRPGRRRRRPAAGRRSSTLAVQPPEDTPSSPAATSGWLRASPPRSAATYVGRTCSRGGDELGELGHAGHHQQAVVAGPVGALDVGVEPVPHDQGPLPADPAQRLLEQRRLRLAGDDRLRGRRTARPPPTSAPLPGPGPDGVGTVRSVFEATHGRPSRTRIAPAITVDQRRSAWKPGHHGGRVVLGVLHGRRPCSLSATSRPSPPMTKTAEPSGSRSASSRAAAWADVTTSASSTSTPSSRRCCGDRPGGARGVVGDEGEVHARPRARPRGARRVRHGVRPDVDDAVEVEHRHVVGVPQRVVTGLEHGRSPAGRTGRVTDGPRVTGGSVGWPPSRSRTMPGWSATTRRPFTLSPFRGLRFVAETVGDLGTVISPPYDVLDAETVRDLEAANRRNIVRLILSRRFERPYLAVRARLHKWRDKGYLRADPDPALYLYEYTADDTTVRGLIGLVGLRDEEERVILPHEDVMAGPVDDRTVLMRTTETNLEPILLVHEGTDPAARPDRRRRAESAGRGLRGARRQRRTGSGWSPTEVLLDAIAAELAGTQALIADGHHRYAAYLRLQAELRDPAAADGASPVGPRPGPAGRPARPPAADRPDPPLGHRPDHVGRLGDLGRPGRRVPDLPRPRGGVRRPRRRRAPDDADAPPVFRGLGRPGLGGAAHRAHQPGRRRGAARRAAAGVGGRGRADRLPPQPRPGAAHHRPAAGHRGGRAPAERCPR